MVSAPGPFRGRSGVVERHWHARIPPQPLGRARARTGHPPCGRTRGWPDRAPAPPHRSEHRPRPYHQQRLPPAAEQAPRRGAHASSSSLRGRGGCRHPRKVRCRPSTRGVGWSSRQTTRPSSARKRILTLLLPRSIPHQTISGTVIRPSGFRERRSSHARYG